MTKINYKKIIYFLFLFLMLSGGTINAQLKVGCYINGFWSEWIPAGNQIKYTMQYDSNNEELKGISFYMKGEDPWNWIFKFEINYYSKPDKKIRKMHLKNDSWYEYSGWVEYYVTDDYPTIKDVLESYKFPVIPPNLQGLTAKRRAKAKIKIQPYKDAPSCFNIWFDDVAVKISFSQWPFDKKYVVK